MEIELSTFDYTLIGAMGVLLMVNTWLQYKLGWSSGTKGGYAVGMYHAVNFLMKNNHLECENATTGKPATAAEIAAYIIHTRSKQDDKDPLHQDPEGLKLLAKALTEKEEADHQ